MTATRRVAIVGLYNSGSSAIAGMLHRLGANLGPPYFATDDESSPDNHYEAYDLSWHLRRWWDEPRGREITPSTEREAFLGHWIRLQETRGAPVSGAKHPLLSLCLPELRRAWGEDVRVIWCWRPLQESQAGLARRGWFGDHAATLQELLWNSLAAAPGLERIDWSEAKEDPAGAARRLAGLVGLDCDDARIAHAASLMSPPVEARQAKPKGLRQVISGWRGRDRQP